MFQLTHSAQVAIVQIQKKTDGLMPMITWFTDSTQREGEWGLGGFVEKADPNVEALRRQKGATFFFDVSGIEFIVDGPMHYLNVLEGATLDYVDERFVLNVI